VIQIIFLQNKIHVKSILLMLFLIVSFILQLRSARSVNKVTNFRIHKLVKRLKRLKIVYFMTKQTLPQYVLSVMMIITYFQITALKEVYP